MKEAVKVATSTFNHTPVLSDQLIDLIKKVPNELFEEGWFLDTTVGGGGHASLLLQEFPKLRLLGIDQDPYAINASSENLKKFGERVKITKSNFANFNPSEKIAIVFADLGVSSPQFDNAKRGFSFRNDGPLDMRMNPLAGVNASELIQQLSEQELADVIYKYGEERFSRRIARKIKSDLATKGPYSGTKDFAYSIAGCYPPKLRNRRIHSATKTFQALRIAVNNELEVLSNLLAKAPTWLLQDGYFAIISFHSLEDRLVKNSFLKDPRLRKTTKKPLIASKEELLINQRSRSAKLRIAQKI